MKQATLLVGVAVALVAAVSAYADNYHFTVIITATLFAIGFSCFALIRRRLKTSGEPIQSRYGRSADTPRFF